MRKNCDSDFPEISQPNRWDSLGVFPAANSPGTPSRRCTTRDEVAQGQKQVKNISWGAIKMTARGTRIFNSKKNT